METRGAAVRRTVEIAVPAHIAYERMCRIEEYPLFRHQVREVSALSDDTLRWELPGESFTARLDAREQDRLLQWHSVDGPECTETVTIKPLSPQRCLVTAELSGPATIVDGLAADLPEFKRRVEHDHPPVGHFVNERPPTFNRHRSNWREQRMIGRTSTGERGTRRGPAA
jgi:hypothetical protein